jgi:hypothetical protein
MLHIYYCFTTCREGLLLLHLSRGKAWRLPLSLLHKEHSAAMLNRVAWPHHAQIWLTTG